MNSELKIMAISAHPADFCSRSGGTLIKHVQAGHGVRVLFLTHGETDESELLYKQKPDISLDQVRFIREKEAFACADVIGADAKMFGFGDNPLRMTVDRIEILAKEIKNYDPDIIITHWKDELTYPTHWKTANSVLQASQLACPNWDIRFFEPNIGSATRVGFIPDHYIDITNVMEQKIEALEKLKAQPHLIELYKTCNRWRGIESKCKYTEAFVRFAPVVPLMDHLA
jgi:4-oxalomesaconate hydratase